MNAIPTVPTFSTPDADAALAWYAEALALVHHFRLREASDIAAHLHVTPAEWAAIDDAWTAALTATSAPLAPGVVLAFASTFARARQRLAQGDPQPSPLRELPTYLRRAPAASAKSAPPVVESRAALAAAAMTRAPSGPEGDDTIVPATLGSTPSLPFVVAEQPRRIFAPCEPCATRTSAEAQVPRASDGHGTAVLGAFMPGAALPFAPPGTDDDADDGNATMMLVAVSAAI